MNPENPKSIADVETLAAKYGVSFSPDDYAQAHMLADQRRQQLEAQLANDNQKTRIAAWVDQFNRFYPKFLKALIGISDVLITLTQTVLIAFGIPALLVMLLIVEQQRVDHGMSLFEVSGPLAAFSATVLVLANLVFELLIGWRENQAGYVEPPRHEFSFRLFAQRIGYLLGQSSGWQPRPKSPAQRFKTVLRVITFTILALAVAGSMRSVIESTNGSWADAIRFVLTQSSLLQAVTWLGGLLFAIAAVLSAQALSQYVAQKVIEIVAIMQSSADDKPRQISEATGLTAAMFLLSRLKENQRNRRLAGAMSTGADLPTVGTFGRVPVQAISNRTTNRQKPATAGDLLTGQDADKNPDKMSKVDRAVALLKADRSLRKLTVRELQARHPDIARTTWSTARRRLGK